MKSVRKYFISFLLVFTFLPALGLSLDEAREKGWVVELPTGYVEAKNPKAQKLADEINAKRKSHYERLAKEKKTSTEAVGALAAKKIQENLKDK